MLRSRARRARMKSSWLPAGRPAGTALIAAAWHSPGRPCAASAAAATRFGGARCAARARARAAPAALAADGAGQARARRTRGSLRPLAQAPACTAQARLDFGYLPGYIGFAAGYIGTETLSTVLLGILGLAASIKIHNKTLRAVRAAGLPAWRWAHGRSLGGVPAWQRAGRILQK